MEYRQAGKILTTLAATALIGGCASIADSGAIHTERELAAAGFQMKLADNPERLAHLETLPQRKLFPTRRGERLLYIYADAKSCQCLYVGSEPDYQEYQRIALRQRAVNETRMAAADLQMAEQNAAMNWGLWGNWRRPFY